MNQTCNLCQTDFTGSFALFFGESSYLPNSQFLIPNSQFSDAFGFAASIIKGKDDNNNATAGVNHSWTGSRSFSYTGGKQWSDKTLKRHVVCECKK